MLVVQYYDEERVRQPRLVSPNLQKIWESLCDWAAFFCEAGLSHGPLKPSL